MSVDADLDIFAGADVADFVGGELHVVGRDAHHALAIHRVAGIDREIDDRILELVRVDIGRPGVAREIDLDADALADRAVEQVRHAADQILAVDPLGQQRLGAGEGQQAAGQSGGAGRAFHRILEVHQNFAARAVQAARARSMPPTTTASMLLKSCAMPPVSWPTASIFWTWRSCASAAWRSSASALSAWLASHSSCVRSRDGLLERFGAFGLGFGLPAGRGVLAKGLKRDDAEEHRAEADDDAEPAQISR